MKFVNFGTDEKTVNYIRKSANQSHLVPVMVPIHTKWGTTLGLRNKNLDTNFPSQIPSQATSQPVTAPVRKPFRVLEPTNHYLSPRTQQVYSLQEVTDKYNKLPDSYKSSFRNLEDFAKKRFFVSNGSNTTSDMYRIGQGRYSDKRFQSVHQPIIQEMLQNADKPPIGKKPICILYGGGSASGKSTVINNIIKPELQKTGLKFAELDCDALKERLPEFSMFSQEDEATVFMRVHRESSDITNECIKALVQDGRCFSWDGCMGNAKRYNTLIGHLKRANYEIHVVGVTVPTDLAIQRARNRKRQVPESIIRANHADFARAFPEVTQMGVDSFSLYDNSQPPGQPNRCIINSDGIQDPKLWDEFLQKGQD